METKLTILIVDDDPGMAGTLSDILEEMGYNTSVAEDGYRAIEMIREKKHDVALMDIKMPGINGVETFKKVKEISPSTRVIMMTAYAVEDLIKEAVEEGAYAVFHKPLDMDKVLDLVEKAGKGGFILVVDDDPNACQTLQDIFMEKGYQVAVAHDGMEGIEFVKKNNFDVIFLDLKMPVLNGLETYLEMKKIRPGVTVVMITGYALEMADLVEEALRQSVYICLQKPLKMEKVLALLEEICGKKRIERG
jgi:DNA-binding NtrC family response regulator